MTTKKTSSYPVLCRDRSLNNLPPATRAYGKPTKPRCYEPSMYQILSWKDENCQQETEKLQQFATNIDNQQQQPASHKKIVHCVSLPSEQFTRSKNPHNFTQNIQSKNQCETPTHEQFRAHMINNQTHYTQIAPKKSQSLKKITNSTKFIESSKQINTGGLQKQSKNPTNQNQKRVFAHQNEPQKIKKLRKKTIPTYNDPENKPRYMQQKKSAVQKFIESPEFDQEKFEKIKQEEIKRFKQTSRDLSNTAFLTYFNKPPFENYGRENKNSSGVLYGDYMYSHSVYPHTGDNHPKNQQTYITPLTRAKSAGNIRPHPPMTRHLEEKLIAGNGALTQIYPKDNEITSIPIKNQTCLDTLPMFNYTRPQQNYSKHNPYVNASEKEDLFTVEDHYMKNEEIPKYYSNKNEIGGKQINYSTKISTFKRASIH